MPKLSGFETFLNPSFSIFRLVWVFYEANSLVNFVNVLLCKTGGKKRESFHKGMSQWFSKVQNTLHTSKSNSVLLGICDAFKIPTFGKKILYFLGWLFLISKTETTVILTLLTRIWKIFLCSNYVRLSSFKGLCQQKMRMSESVVVIFTVMFSQLSPLSFRQWGFIFMGKKSFTY